MCDDLLAYHHRISAPSSIPLSSDPTWFTTQPAKPTDAPARTYLFLPLSFSIDPVTCLSTSGSPTTRKKPTTASSVPSAASATTTFDYFPAFFDINKRWTIYAFDKSVLALYPQKADRCEMIYEMVYSHAEHAHRHHPQLLTQHHHRDHHPHHSHHPQPHPHTLHTQASPPRGRIGYPSSTPHSRSSSPGPHHHQHHTPHIPNLTSSYDLVEDTTWFTSTHPHLRTLLTPPNGSGNTGEKCLSLIDLHSPPTHPQKRAGYILLSLPTPSSPNRLYISRLEIFPEYRGAGGGRHWSLVGRGLVKMLLEAVVEVAGDFGGSGIAGEGVDVWINLGAETETEVGRCALGMGWVVNRCLWVVEKNEVNEVEEEGKKKKGGSGLAVKAQGEKAREGENAPQQQQQKEISGADAYSHAGGNSVQKQQQEVKQEAPAAAVHLHAGVPVGMAHPSTSTSHVHAHAQGNSKQGKHWSFGEWGKGMKGWRERWVKALDDISHGHGHGHGKA